MKAHVIKLAMLVLSLIFAGGSLVACSADIKPAKEGTIFSSPDRVDSR
jgi:hypothetical protein